MSSPKFWTPERRQAEYELLSSLSKLDAELDKELDEADVIEGDAFLEGQIVEMAIGVPLAKAQQLMEAWAHYYHYGCDEPREVLDDFFDFIAELLVEIIHLPDHRRE